jgi:tetratricopeptide (TPR) repeat protein
LFRRVLELNPKDFDANFEIAALFEQTEPLQALIYYDAGINIMREEIGCDKSNRFIEEWPSSFSDPTSHLELSKSMIPPELLNNLAVLLMQANKNGEAKATLEEALKNCDTLLEKGDKNDTRVKALRITTRFNLACSLEKNLQIGDASELFKAIISEEPTYTDAYLRLAYLARTRGDVKRALEYVDMASKNLIQNDRLVKPVNLFCIKAKMLLDSGNTQEAKAQYSKAMEHSHNKDAFARVGLANIAYLSSCLFRSEVQKQEDYMRYAMRQYFGILEIDENNCFGSLGIANLLTEYNKVDEAKEVYKLLAISEPDSQVGLNALLNQAHILTFENGFDQAIKLYEVCLTKKPGDLDI